MHLCLVTCSYDTDFEPIAEQLATKLEQIRREFNNFTLIIMNDALDQSAFAEAIRSVGAPEVVLYNVETPNRSKWGHKGLALREGLRLGLTLNADIYGYLNLNLKVDAKFLRLGVETMNRCGWTAAFGSRASCDGGIRQGAGKLGELKSLAFVKLAHKLLPKIRDAQDTNGPMKLFRPETAKMIVDLAQGTGAFFDCEWLLILAVNHENTGFFPIVWKQRAGSRPPWFLVQQSVRELAETRERWLLGLYEKYTSR